MSKYATEKTFDNRRARVGDVVILACPKYDMRQFMPPNVPDQKMCLRAGIVGAISSSEDLPYLRDLRAGTEDARPDWWEFVATKTEEEIEALEIGQWTWPLDLVLRCAEGFQKPVSSNDPVPV